MAAPRVGLLALSYEMPNVLFIKYSVVPVIRNIFKSCLGSICIGMTEKTTTT